MADPLALIDSAIAELRQTTISGAAYFAKPGPGHWHNALDDLAAAKAAIPPPPLPPPPPPPSWPPAGATLADALNGHFDAAWLFEASDPQGGSSEVPVESWEDDGAGGKCLQFTMPPSASPNTSQGELISRFRGNGDAAALSKEGMNSLYDFDFRVPADGNFMGGTWDWFYEWRVDGKIVKGNSTAWRLVGSTGSNLTTPAPDAYLELRPSGGPDTGVVYSSFKTPLGVVKKGAWNTLVTRIKWGIDAAHGEVQAWLNDVEIVPTAHVPTLIYNAATGQRDLPATGLYHYSYRKSYATKRQFRRVAVLPA